MDYDKLYQAIKLVAYNRLDECRDDTLIEKLVTVFDDTFDSVNCSNEQLKSIYDLCVQSIEHWQKDQTKVAVSPVFSFMFKLIASPDVHQVIGRQTIITQLNQLIDLKSKVFKCDYSIQFSYVKGLIKFFTNQEASTVMNECKIDNVFVNNLINHGIESQSFFVKKSIQQCLVQLIKRSSDNEILSYVQLIVSSFELKINKFQINIISQLMASDMRSTIMRLHPDLNQKLITHVNCQTDENALVQLVDLLAFNLKDEPQINLVFIKLIKNKLLKPLITFSTNLCSKNSNYLNKWFIYVVLPLQLQYEDESINSSETDFNYSEFDKKFVQSLSNEKILIYCLHHLRINFPKQLTCKQLHKVINIINRFIIKLIEQSKIKLLRESLLMIGNLSKQLDQQLEPEMFSTLIDIFINMLWSEHLKCECLIWLRHLFESDLNHRRLANDNNIKVKVIDLVENLLKLELEDENLDVIDGGLELLHVLIKNDCLKLNELDQYVLKSILNIWNYSTQQSDNSFLRTSCIPLLLSLHLQLDQSTLNTFSIGSSIDQSMMNDEKFNSSSIITVFWRCLKDEDSLVRRKTVESIREYFLSENQIKDEMINRLTIDSGELYTSICYHVSESVLFDIDADIQLVAMNLLKCFLINIIKLKSISNDLISSTVKFKGLLYFIHSLHFTIMNNLVCFTVKEEFLSTLQDIRKCLYENSITRTDLKTNIGDHESVFEYQVSCHKVDDQSTPDNRDINAKKFEQLNEMFKDNLFRTEEIIAQFTNERTEQAKSNSPNMNKSKDHQTSIISKMSIDTLLDFLYIFDMNTILNNEIKVDFLDDILAARANDDVIIDCY